MFVLRKITKMSDSKTIMVSPEELLKILRKNTNKWRYLVEVDSEPYKHDSSLYTYVVENVESQKLYMFTAERSSMEGVIVYEDTEFSECKAIEVVRTEYVLV